MKPLNSLPLVCICVPTYNAAYTVGQALTSILAQTYPNIVVLVLDNASTDKTLNIVEAFTDPRINIYRNDKNVGGEGNFNRCIQLATGKYTAIFHADDIYEADMVAKQVDFLESNPKAGAVFTEANTINKDGNKIGELRLPKSLVSTKVLFDFSTMFKAVLRHSNFFICPSVMIRTHVYQQEIKCWRGAEFKSSADLDVWLRILQNHPIGYLQERLMRYRISTSQWSAQVRGRTQRADFFLVTDHYLTLESVRALLDATDLNNYKRLGCIDRAICALNLYEKGHTKQANDLVHDLFSWDALAGAFQDKRGMLALLGVAYIKLLTLMRLHRLGRILLTHIKRVVRL